MKKETNEHNHEQPRDRKRKDANDKTAVKEVKKFLADKTKPDKEAFNPYISMYSLALSVHRLLELYDNQPGKDGRIQAVDELVKEFRRFTSVPYN